MALNKIPQILIKDYTYDLPQERIASYPLSQRDASKLLIYNKGIITDTIFRNIVDLIPSDSIMVFNDTKVVPARLLFQKDTGALIEIFCLEPHDPVEYNLSFAAVGRCSWKAIAGNVKKWKSGYLSLYLPEQCDSSVRSLDLKAELISRFENSFIINFTWNGDVPFSKVLDICGKVPIPPYLRRESEAIDTDRYQTLYARYRGSVAAPTAGLHFTDGVLARINAKGIDCEQLCLHVGAGTFLPVKSEAISGHTMHSEPFSVTANFLNKLYQKTDNQKLIAVGTTSVRSLESLFYLGQQCYKATPQKWVPVSVEQWEPYENEEVCSAKESLGSLLEYLKINDLDTLHVRTRIIILPTYKFKFVDGLVTNFHQPQSTLLLLIAAFIGKDWKRVYQYALNNDFRFLSYGDSSLLIR